MAERKSIRGKCALCEEERQVKRFQTEKGHIHACWTCQNTRGFKRFVVQTMWHLTELRRVRLQLSSHLDTWRRGRGKWGPSGQEPPDW